MKKKYNGNLSKLVMKKQTTQSIKSILILVSMFLCVGVFGNANYNDEIGNLFKTKDKTDREYGKAGQLLKDETYTYSYDKLGNLIKKESLTEKWEYIWTTEGRLANVIRPNKEVVKYKYDALGRRISKTYNNETQHFVWNGNVLLHEWKAEEKEDLITWIFEEGSFVPQAKLQNGKSYSIITDHLGTPTDAYDEQGKKVWSRELDIYGKPRQEQGQSNFVPFTYQGQYYDEEIELAYNRFRWYDNATGIYISQDPIFIEGGFNIYAYVHDSNTWIDPFGLSSLPLGFKSFGQLKQFGQQIQGTLARGGFKNTGVFMQGSSVSGRSFSTGVPFDVGRVSDFDVAITNPDLLKKAQELDLGKAGRNMSMPLKADDMRKLGFGDLADSLSERFGREVNFRIFDNEASVRAKGKSYKISCH